MKIIQIIKWSAAVLLLITFFLPLSRCATNFWDMRSTPETSSNNLIEQTNPNPHQLKEEQSSTRYHYFAPYKMFKADEIFSWLLLLSFTWPLPILLSYLHGKYRRIIQWLKLIEPFASLGSGYMVFIISFLGEIMYGGYLAISSIIVYFLATCVNAFMVVRQLILRKRKTINKIKNKFPLYIGC